MKALRYVAAAAVLLVAAAAIQRGPWSDYRCNAEKRRLRDLFRTALDRSSSFEQVDAARSVIATLKPCVERDPADYEGLLLLGYAYKTIGDADAALETFQQALRVNERPEIYTNIGLIHLERGNAEEARRNLLYASYFTIEATAAVSMPLQEELYVAAERRHARLRKLAEEKR